jgi:hypothetical protein
MTALSQTLARRNIQAGRHGFGAVARGLPGARPRGPGISAFVSPPPVHFSSDPNAIVTVEVKTIIAPTPNNYQQTGAFVSFGGTNMNPMEVQELTQRSDLDLIVDPPLKIDSMTWAAGGQVTVVVDGILPPNFQVGYISVSGCSPAVYNNHHTAAAIIDQSSFSYTSDELAAGDPGPASELGVVTKESSVEVSQMATTYFSQGNAISVWVLELGDESDFEKRTALIEEWLNLNPRSFYGYLLPRAHGTSNEKIGYLKNLFKQYESPEAMTYFWLTVDKEEIGFLDKTYKAVIQGVEAPEVLEPLNLADPYGEFTLAAMFYNAMIYKPSNARRVAPMAFKFAYGCTHYPTQNNGPLLKSFKDNCTNYISTGAEGGIDFNMIYTGVTRDGMDYFNWWWTIDWVQIQINVDLSNCIINGANDALAPLYYDQGGIDTLHACLTGTMINARAFGMVVGPIVMSGSTGDQLNTDIANGVYEGACNTNAVPFVPYSRSNPGHYKIGEYDGLSTLFIPKRGFIHVLVTVAASQLVTV